MTNNGTHETIGGMSTITGQIDLVAVAKGCGYPYAMSVDSYMELDRKLEQAKERDGLGLIEEKCALGARADLGRPTTTGLKNKRGFMECLDESGNAIK